MYPPKEYIRLFFVEGNHGQIKEGDYATAREAKFMQLHFYTGLSSSASLAMKCSEGTKIPGFSAISAPTQDDYTYPVRTRNDVITARED